MKKIIITGGKKLQGEVKISGSKNAALAILPACILSSGACILENLPSITDVTYMSKILCDMGANIKMLNSNSIKVDCSSIKSQIVPQDLARKIRASYYLVGALMGKFSRAIVSLPGGCDFGVRPIDQHVKGLCALGAKYKIKGGTTHFYAKELIGSNIYFDTVSVGSTINIMLASAMAKGCTIIENAAKEPHIVDLANFLNCMGADIRGAGTDMIKIYGVKKLYPTKYSIIPDQIEAGTYMVAALATGGSITLKKVICKHLEPITAKLQEIGAFIKESGDSLFIKSNEKLNKCHVKTGPHPGFPTDMQSQITALLSTVQGTSIVHENVWDNRFRYIDELKRMGAQISVDGKVAIIEGVNNLLAAQVKATDLRAGAAMIIAGLIAKGTSIIEGTEHIERGYEDISKKLSLLGAKINCQNIDEKNIAIMA